MANRKLTKNEEGLLQKLTEVTADLQRTRADFENYRKNVEADKQRYGDVMKNATVLKLLPIIDDIERAVGHLPAELAENEWAKGIANLSKNLPTLLDSLGVSKIAAQPGTKFDPNLHDAAQFDEQAEGETEVIAAELQPGYLLDGQPLRHAMVKVTRQ
jgi:molecular chaperone GrpE